MRLPTVWLTRPLSHPLITWLGLAPMVKPNGWPPVPCFQDASNTWPVRQFTPVYWTTTVSPWATAGPVPLIRVFDTRLVGGLPEGILMVGAAPLVSLTVGRPFPGEAWVPLTDALGAKSWSMSTTKTRVSVGL